MGMFISEMAGSDCNVTGEEGGGLDQRHTPLSSPHLTPLLSSHSSLLLVKKRRRFLSLYNFNDYKYFNKFSSIYIIYRLKISECMLLGDYINIIFILSFGEASDSSDCSPPTSPYSTAPEELAD